MVDKYNASRRISKRTFEIQRAKALLDAVEWLNRSPLGCSVAYKTQKETYRYIDRRLPNLKYGTNIEGVSADGRAIYIQYIISHRPRQRPPLKAQRLFMQEMAAKNAIVGCAYDYGDCWDIVIGKSRRLRTFSYREDYNDKRKENKGSGERYDSNGNHER